MKDTKVKTRVSNDLIDKCTELCVDVARALADTTYEEVWAYFLRRHLGAVSATVAKSDFTHEEWQAAYDEFYAAAHSKLATAKEGS